MDYDNTNRGALFKAEKSEESYPDYTGSINVGGTEYWLSAWIKVSKKGSKFMSLSVKPKDAPKPAKRSSGFEDLDDDIPY